MRRWGGGEGAGRGRGVTSLASQETLSSRVSSRGVCGEPVPLVVSPTAAAPAPLDAHGGGLAPRYMEGEGRGDLSKSFERPRERRDLGDCFVGDEAPDRLRKDAAYGKARSRPQEVARQVPTGRAATPPALASRSAARSSWRLASPAWRAPRRPRPRHLPRQPSLAPVLLALRLLALRLPPRRGGSRMSPPSQSRTCLLRRAWSA